MMNTQIECWQSKIETSIVAQELITLYVVVVRTTCKTSRMASCTSAGMASEQELSNSAHTRCMSTADRQRLLAALSGTTGSPNPSSTNPTAAGLTKHHKLSHKLCFPASAVRRLLIEGVGHSEGALMTITERLRIAMHGLISQVIVFLLKDTKS